MRVSKIVAAGATALAVCGVLGTAPPAAHASSASDATWTQQDPSIHPPARTEAASAYDAATGTVVMFGGFGGPAHLPKELSDTWTWDGTTWTQQHPATHPSARLGASMAYDAATGTIVLFGGDNTHGPLSDTWTWDGTTWTLQHPAAHPPTRADASMAYDAATGTVVLYGGSTSKPGVKTRLLGDTWTWNGTTWTKQHPATSPPCHEEGAATAYDAATGTVVLFGGDAGLCGGLLSDTWTWDGTTWTQQHPAASPSARVFASMAYDAATGTAVLFGGRNVVSGSSNELGDTWAWDGTTWTQQAPATNPSPRDSAAMAYDAATGTAVLFGGFTSGSPAKDTWTWG